MGKQVSPGRGLSRRPSLLEQGHQRQARDHTCSVQVQFPLRAAAAWEPRGAQRPAPGAAVRQPPPRVRCEDRGAAGDGKGERILTVLLGRGTPWKGCAESSSTTTTQCAAGTPSWAGVLTEGKRSLFQIGVHECSKL